MRRIEVKTEPTWAVGEEITIVDSDDRETKYLYQGYEKGYALFTEAK